MIRRGIIALTILVVFGITQAALQPLILVAERTKCTIDPVPYEKLLADTLEKIIASNWEVARSLINIGENTYTCDPRVALQQRSIYGELLVLINLLENVSVIERDFNDKKVIGLRDKISEIYNNLNIIIEKINKNVVSYNSLLSKHAQDKISFYEYARRVSRYLNTLKIVVSTAMKKLVNMYILLEEESTGRWLDVVVFIPRRMLAGEEVSIWVLTKLMANENLGTNISEVNLSVTIIVGGVLEISKQKKVPLGLNASIEMRLPDTREMYEKGVELTKLASLIYAVPAEVVVEATSSNGKIRGFSINSTFVYAFVPSIRFYVPNYAENGNISIKTESSTDSPVNVSFFIDKVSNSTFIENATIFPGSSLIRINLSNVTPGYHTLIIVSAPIGKYIPAKWSSAIVFGAPSVPIILNIPRIVLVPPFVIGARGRLGVNIPSYEIIIYIGNIEAYRSTFSGKEFNVLLGLPISISSLFIGREIVKVVVIPRAPGFKPASYTVEVTVINVISTFLVVGLTGILYLHPKTATAFLSLIKFAFLKRDERRTKRKSLITRKHLFRPFRLRRYYQRVINILAGLAGHPAPSETLREYLMRVRVVVSARTADILDWLFTLFEEDLYSTHDINYNEAKKLTEELEKELYEESEQA